MTPVDAMVLSTVRILAGDATGAKSIGTGFLYAFPRAGDEVIPALVTNKHVLGGWPTAQIVLTVSPVGVQPGQHGRPAGAVNEAFDIPINASTRIDHPDPAVDLCCLLVGPVWNHLQQEGKQAWHFMVPSTFRLNADTRALLRAVEPIAMVGYPTGLWDQVNNAPVVRRGITASHPLVRWEGSPIFLIDAACFPGSSGSPVFLYEDGMYRSGENAYSPGYRVVLIGVLYAGPQYTATGELRPEPIPHNVNGAAVTNIPMNLGFVISADELDRLGEALLSWLANAGAPPSPPVGP